MNSKLSVCFGASLIIIGGLNFIFETNNIILFGMNLSALLFSLINYLILRFHDCIKSDKIEFFYIIPFVVFLFFCCFSESLKNFSLIESILSSQISNAITFLSFGLIFIAEYSNYKNEMKISRKLYGELSLENANSLRSALLKIMDYGDSITNVELLNSIKYFFAEQTKKMEIELELFKSEKDYFSIVDFNKIYTEKSEILNYKKEEKNKFNE